MCSPIPYVNTHGTILHSITLSNNPLHCDCRLSWVVAWLDYYRRAFGGEAHERRVRALNATMCRTPWSLRHMPLATVNFGRGGAHSVEQHLSPRGGSLMADGEARSC